MPIEQLIQVAQTFAEPGQRRVEGKLVETAPYRWAVLVEHIDLDHPDLSYVLPVPVPGYQGLRKARWLAWELGFKVTD